MITKKLNSHCRRYIQVNIETRQATDVRSAICFVHIFLKRTEQNYDDLILDVGWTPNVLEPYEVDSTGKLLFAY